MIKENVIFFILNKVLFGNLSRLILKKNFLDNHCLQCWHLYLIKFTAIQGIPKYLTSSQKLHVL